MKNYESLILLVPDITEGKIDSIMECVGKHSMVQNSERWGIKRMAFPVKQKNSRISYITAYHILVKLKTEDEELKTLEKKLENNDDVVKFISIRTER